MADVAAGNNDEATAKCNAKLVISQMGHDNPAPSAQIGS
jgi:hypothetical protein